MKAFINGVKLIGFKENSIQEIIIKDDLSELNIFECKIEGHEDSKIERTECEGMKILIDWLDDLQIDLQNAETFLDKLKIYAKMEKIRRILRSNYTTFTYLGGFTIEYNNTRV